MLAWTLPSRSWLSSEEQENCDWMVIHNNCSLLGINFQREYKVFLGKRLDVASVKLNMNQEPQDPLILNVKCINLSKTPVIFRSLVYWSSQ